VAPDGALKEVVQRWYASVKYRFSRGLGMRVRDFNRCFLDPVQSVIQYCFAHPEGVVGTIINVNEKPSALWIGSRVSDQCLAIYVLIADTAIKNLSDYTLYSCLRQAHEMGIAWVNLGGSEVKSLFEFKAKLSIRPNSNVEVGRRLLDFTWRPECPKESGRSVLPKHRNKSDR